MFYFLRFYQIIVLVFIYFFLVEEATHLFQSFDYPCFKAIQ